jgi:hypothetical protein
VRRHRERRRNGLRLFTVTIPETVIENAIARGLLATEDRAEPWPVIQGCYAGQLSDAALDWLVHHQFFWRTSICCAVVFADRIFDLLYDTMMMGVRSAGGTTPFRIKLDL